MAVKTDAEMIHFGWFIPTAGDTTAFGVPSATTPPSLELFERVAKAAESAGFEYALVPVQTACYEAWITCAMIAARTESLKLLVAARPGYIKPHMMAKMVSTLSYEMAKLAIFISRTPNRCDPSRRRPCPRTRRAR